MGIKDQPSADDIIKYVRYLQGFQERAGHPSVYSLNNSGEQTAELGKRMERLNRQRETVLNNIDKLDAGEELPPQVTPADVQAMLDIVNSKERPKMPETLKQFIARNGGMIDEGGELASMGLTPKTHPKLVRSARTSINEPNMFGKAGSPVHAGIDPDKWDVLSATTGLPARG